MSNVHSGTTPAANSADLKRGAEELALAADRAAAMEQRRGAEWRSASARAQAAWQAYVAAESRLRRVARAMAFPARSSRGTRYSRAERERHLHRAVTAAFWRRELTVLQLSDALAHRNGWDLRCDPIEQEVRICRVARDNFLASYRTAASQERAAWRAVEAAAAAAQRLRAEAVVAAVRAHRAADVPQPKHFRVRAGTGVVWRPSGPVKAVPAAT